MCSRANCIFKPVLLVFICGYVLFFPLLVTADEKTQHQSSACNTSKPIIFGILPFVSAEQLVVRFSPIASYISDKLKTRVHIETAPDFAEFAKRTNIDQRYDILFTAPHFYPPAHNKAGYRLIAGVDSPGMWAIIVTPEKSDIFTLDDLRGKRLATVHPKALATLLIKKHLSDAGINPDTALTLVATPSHDASLLSSYHGITDASSLMQPPYEAASETVKNNMRIIARTESTPHIPISVSPNISNACAEKISEILLNMKQSKKGKQALSKNNFSGFKKTSAEDYKKMEVLLQQ